MSNRDPQKTVPYNVDAEIAIMGSILIDPGVYGTVSAIVQPEHFYIQKNRWIYEAMGDIVTRGDPVDYVTLTSELESRKKLEAIGGGIYISQLISSVPSALNAETYARLVRETYNRRQVLDLVTDVARMAYNEQDDLAAARIYIQSRIDELLTTTGPQTYQSFDELAKTLPPITWLWENWLPLGMLSMLGAVPGAGKSLVALDLARRVMSGEAFPDNTLSPFHRTGKNVIYVDAEMVPQLLNDRVQAWKMDCKKLFLMLPQPNRALDFSSIEDQERLRNMAATLAPGLIVVDSLSSVNPKGENNVEDVRDILAFLNELAATNNTSVLLIHHLRKRGGIQPHLPMDLSIDDFRGSSHIIAMARSVIGLSVIQTTAEMDRNGPRKLEVLKTNLTAYPEPLGCEVVKGYPRGVVLKWANEAPKPYKEPSKIDRCLEWLEDVLSKEPLSPKELVELGRYEGYSRSTIYRARSQAGQQINDTEGRQAPTNKWEWVSE